MPDPSFTQTSVFIMFLGFKTYTLERKHKKYSIYIKRLYSTCTELKNTDYIRCSCSDMRQLNYSGLRNLDGGKPGRNKWKILCDFG